MDTRRARAIAFSILEDLEELLGERGVFIPAPRPTKTVQTLPLNDRDFFRLRDAIVDDLVEEVGSWRGRGVRQGVRRPAAKTVSRRNGQ